MIFDELSTKISNFIRSDINDWYYDYSPDWYVDLNRLYNLNQMELGRIEEQVEMLQSVGFTLNVEER